MIDFITVVFRPELFYLQIQAQSIERYIDTDKIGTIFVIVNDQESVCSLVDTAWWGINQDKVKIIWAASFGSTHFINGWESQQYYKLATANIADSEWSMCLDAKTWFISTLDFGLLFDDKKRVRFKKYRNWFSQAEKTLNIFFETENKSIIAPAGVPFLFNTEQIHLLIKFIENKGITLHRFFTHFVRNPWSITEFTLYSAWIQYQKIFGKLYNTNQYYNVTNIAGHEAKDFDYKLDQMRAEETLTASIHRVAYPKLTNQQLEIWVDFLRSKNLINNFSNEKVISELLNTANVE